MSLDPATGVRPLAALLAYRPRSDGRIVIVAAVAVYLAIVALPRLLGGTDIWPRLGVPSGPSLFFDARNVLAAMECRRLGLDPLVENPCDPWDRPMNYPRPLLLLRVLGLDQSHTFVFGAAVLIAFLAAVLLLVRRITIGEGVVTAIAVCSPAAMFAVERANLDLLLFSILVAAVVLWRTGASAAVVVSPALVFAAGAIKIYPAFALLAFVFTRNFKAALAAVSAAVAFTAYLALTLRDVAAVARTAPQGEYYSYGARILLARAYHQLVPETVEWNAAAAQAVAVVPLLALAAWAWVWARRRLLPEDQRRWSPSAERLAFHAGALIYLGTFAVGNNFDYRLVYLLLALPQLFAWVKEGPPAEALTTVAALALALVVTALWVGTLSEYVGLGDEFVSWSLAAVLAVLIAGSAPPLRFVPSALWGGRHSSGGRPVGRQPAGG